MGDAGRSIEVGTPIGITRRIYVRNRIIQSYYCVFQYKSLLKAERYGNVRVVSLLSVALAYQSMSREADLKYGDGDISESSLVFLRSKDGRAGGKPLLSQSATNLMK